MKWDVIQPLSSTLSHGLVWPVTMDCKMRIRLSDRTTFVVRRLTFPCSDISDTTRCAVSFYLWCLYLPISVYLFLIHIFVLFPSYLCVLFSCSVSLCVFSPPPYLCVSFVFLPIFVCLFLPPHLCLFSSSLSLYLFSSSLSLYVFSLPIFVVVSFLSIFVCLFSP